MFGKTCNTRCPFNCSTCSQATGRPCISCKATFYDTTSECSKSCSAGCDRGACYENGTCSTCTANFEGTKCETCKQGKYGSLCTQFCANKNCRCSTGTDCTSCKTGFYGRSTFCQTPCSPGCQDGVCNDNGSCKCLTGFTGSTCSKCRSGYYGAYCNVSCSEGCVNGLCSRDGTCSCRQNFVTAKCDKCLVGRYGVNCDINCSIGCTTSSCDQCKSGFYEQLCNLPCSDNCKEFTCSRYQGKCTHGCVAGYSGENCTNPCDETCATCLQHDKSYCSTCRNGYSGSTCRCAPNCNCDSTSEICTECKDGYNSPEKECKCQAQYCIGTKCDQCINITFYVANNVCCECPDNCKDGTCKSGPECISGCLHGFYGLNCSQSCLSLSADCLRCRYEKCLECEDGFYPYVNGSCMSCSSHCKSGLCNSETGACINGCVEKFRGDKCDSLCGPNCDIEGNDSSERRNNIGSSTSSALAAVYGVLGFSLICTAAGYYLWNRRRSTPSVTEQEDQRETEMTYEQLQRRANEPTYMNADENYSVLSV